MPKDPRILTREEVLRSSSSYRIDGHDLAQRERIATLEADNRRLREALGKIAADWIPAYMPDSPSSIAHAALQPAARSPQPSGYTGEMPHVEDEFGCLVHSVKSCPDCSAARPATEQPRIWRVRNAACGLVTVANGDKSSAWLFARLYGGTLIYSTDNGKTWVDEQAEREGK